MTSDWFSASLLLLLMKCSSHVFHRVFFSRCCIVGRGCHCGCEALPAIRFLERLSVGRAAPDEVVRSLSASHRQVRVGRHMRVSVRDRRLGE